MPEDINRNSDRIVDMILNEMEDENCVLILGPEFYFLSNNEENEIESMQDHLKKSAVQDIGYLTEEGLFYCSNESQNAEILTNIRRFFKGLTQNSLYEKIAQIPFPLYISLSPDIILQKTFLSLGLNCQFAHYMPGTTTAEGDEVVKIGKPVKANPLIYNLMGSYQMKDSIVFTHEALFSYMSTIFQQNDPARKHIQTCLSNASYFIFLGFRFDQWYLKLLFFLFKKGLILPDKYGKIQKIALLFKNPEVPDNILNYYKSEFNFEFLQESQTTFIDKLYQACEKKKMLRTKEDSGDAELQDIIRKKGQNDLKNAAAIVTKMINRKDFPKSLEGLKILMAGDEAKLGEVESIEGGLHLNEDRRKRNSITEDEYLKAISKLEDRLTDLAEGMIHQ